MDELGGRYDFSEKGKLEITSDKPHFSLYQVIKPDFRLNIAGKKSSAQYFSIIIPISLNTPSSLQ